MLKYTNISLCVDIMYVNRNSLFISVCKNIKFITCTALDNRKQKTLVDNLIKIYSLYLKRGFKITLVLGNGEFDCTRADVAKHLKSELNICGPDEHVTDV